MRKLMVLALALPLAGCASYVAERDDEKCRSYSAPPGSAAYVQCRAQLDSARTIAWSNYNPQPVQPMAGPASPPYQDPSAGHTSDPGWRGLPR